MTVHQFKSKLDLTIEKNREMLGTDRILQAEVKDFLVGMAIQLQERRFVRLTASYINMRIYWVGLDILNLDGGSPEEIAEAERLAEKAQRRFDRASSAFYATPLKFDRPPVMKPLWSKEFATPYDAQDDA